MTLFDPGAAIEDSKALSYGARLSQRNKAMIANGKHPITKVPLADNGHTCGDCAHHVVSRYSKAYHKCDYRRSAGPATDLRVSWPACEKWEAEA